MQLIEFNILNSEFFSFNSYVYYLTLGFIGLACTFNLVSRAFSLVIYEFELVTRGFELVTRGFALVTHFYFLKSLSCSQDFLVLVLN